MSTLAIILIVVVVVLTLLFAGGYVANRRRYDAEDADLRRQIAEADHALAAARAEDRGWQRDLMEAAAREAAAPLAATPVEQLMLIKVVDRPGTDADEAVFVVTAGGEQHEVRIGRRDGAWVPA